MRLTKLELEAAIEALCARTAGEGPEAEGIDDAPPMNAYHSALDALLAEQEYRRTRRRGRVRPKPLAPEDKLLRAMFGEKHPAQRSAKL
jgi:hypothetical protein